MERPAKEIYQDLLDRLARALRARDVSLWADCMALPHTITTCDGHITIETEKDIEVTFDDYLAILDGLGVIDSTRTCEFARLSEPGWIEGYHSAVMLLEGSATLQPYTAKWVLCEDSGGNWRVRKIDSALNPENYGHIAYRDMALFEPDEKSSQMRRLWETQRTFDKMDKILLHGTFEEWLQAFKLPISIETPINRVVIDTKKRLREEYELYQGAFRINRVTDYTRVLQSVEQVDEKTRIARYRAHLLSGPRYVVPPWNAQMTLRLEDGRWYTSKLFGAVGPLFWRCDTEEQESVPPVGGA